MIILLGPAALSAAIIALWQGASALDALVFALATALAAFGGWAIGREIDPDNQASAFVSLALAVLVMLLLGPGSTQYALLILFTTLGLVRQVNRSTGLEARLTDSVLLLALTLWVIYATANPLFGLVAGISFAFDGSLERPLRRQLVFALLSFGAIIVYMVDHDIAYGLYSVPGSLPQWLAAFAAVLFGLSILLMRNVRTVADVSRRPLRLPRVRGGMAVALFAVLQGLPEVREVALLAASAAAISLSGAFRRSFKSPAVR